MAGSDSDSDEEKKRVVKSAKDKALEELAHVCDDLRVGMQALNSARAGSRILCFFHTEQDEDQRLLSACGSL